MPNLSTKARSPPSRQGNLPTRPRSTRPFRPWSRLLTTTLPGWSNWRRSFGRSNGPWSFVETGTLVLDADGTASLTSDSFEREVYIDTFATHDSGTPDVPIIGRVDFSTPIDDAVSGSVPGTWSINGQEITLSIEGEDFALNVSADGNILMTGAGGLETAGDVSLLVSNMAMAVRTNPPDIAVETIEGVALTNDGPSIQFVVPVNGQVTKSFRILNLGDADLTNMSLQLSGTPFRILDGLVSPTLGALPGQVLIRIQYEDRIGDEEIYFGELHIFSDDPDTPDFIVNLVRTAP